MNNVQRFEKHERLMRQTADANGVDLDLAAQQGNFSQDEYWASVLACTGCSDPGACEKQLRDGRSGIPAFCRNGDTMRRLSGVAPSLD